MKFLHISDLHLGKYLNQVSLIQDQKYALDQIIEIIKNEKIECLFISGDIYDRQIPNAEAVSLFNDFLEQIVKGLRIKTFVITGNHDSSERLAFASKILEDEGLYIVTYPTKPITKKIVYDEYGKINIYMLPYSSNQSLVSKGIKNYEEMIKYYLDNSDIDYEQRNILLTHHTVLYNNKVIRSDSESIINIGGLDMINANLFSKFDYVALGHLHIEQKVGFDHIRYSGSLLKYSESEANDNKKVIIGTLKEKNNLTFFYINIPYLHNLKVIKGDILELLENITEIDEDYVYIILTNNILIPNAMQRLKVKYPNALSLKYEFIESFSPSEETARSSDFHQKTYLDQFKEFYKAISNKELDASSSLVLEETIKKVGEKNETN